MVRVYAKGTELVERTMGKARPAAGEKIALVAVKWCPDPRSLQLVRWKKDNHPLVLGGRLMCFSDRVVLVTGGTGSFGRKFVSRILELDNPRKVIVFSRGELKHFEMQQSFDDERLRYFIGDVRDADRLRRAFQGVDTVIHAAALKQVPACEYNPFEAVRTNIIGAENVINAAVDMGVKRVLAISTDKAVNPINLYGATKLCAEKLFTQGNTYSASGETRFACARYGNVVGSRGSIVPLFRKQASSGVLTITDKRMTRFWITLEQAVDFVRTITGLMKGGEVFVPKIPCTRVVDLARVIAPEAELKEIGIRPGEKIHEVLVTDDEARFTLDMGSYFVIQPRFPWWTSERPKGVKGVPTGFSYSSNDSAWQLSEEKLRDIVSE